MTLDVYTIDEINEFLADKYPWMENIVLSPTKISFSENMYGDEYCILKQKCETGIRYIRQIKDVDSKVFVHDNASEGESEIAASCRTIELDLFMNSIFNEPNLSNIPMDYICSMPTKYKINESAIPFLLNLIQVKLEQNSN